MAKCESESHHVFLTLKNTGLNSSSTKWVHRYQLLQSFISSACLYTGDSFYPSSYSIDFSSHEFTLLCCWLTVGGLNIESSSVSFLLQHPKIFSCCWLTLSFWSFLRSLQKKLLVALLHCGPVAPVAGEAREAHWCSPGQISGILSNGSCRTKTVQSVILVHVSIVSLSVCSRGSIG